MAEEYEVILDEAADRDHDGIIHYLMTTYSTGAAEAAVRAIQIQLKRIGRYPEAHPQSTRKGLVPHC